MALRRLVTFCAVSFLLLSVTSSLTGCGGKPAPSKPANAPKVFSKADFTKALASTKSMAPDQAVIKLSKLAIEAFDADEREPAKEAMGEALKRMDEMTGEEPADTLVEMWSISSPALYKVGKRDEARANLKKAVEVAAKIEKPEPKARSLARLATAQHSITQTPDAITTLKRAEDLTGKEEDPVAKLTILGAVAEGEQAIGKADQAERIVKSMTEIAGTATEPEVKAKYLAMVAGTQIGIEKKDAGAETFKQAREAAESVKDPLKRVFAMFNVGQKMWQSKQFKSGREVLEACRSSAMSTESLKNKQAEFKVMYEEIAGMLK